MFGVFKRNKLILVTLILLSAQVSFARSNEPATNIGATLSAMKMKFPELRYIGTDEKGDEYEDGHPEDGIGVYPLAELSERILDSADGSVVNLV